MSRIVAFLFILLYAFDSSAVLKVDINRGGVRKYNISVSTLACKVSELGVCREIQNTIESNLERSGEFSLVNLQYHDIVNIFGKGVMDGYNGQLDENFKCSSVPGLKSPVSFLLFGSVSPISEDMAELRIRLWDVAQSKSVVNKGIKFDVSRIRNSAHIASDHIFQSVTGSPGHFNTKIVYTAWMKFGEDAKSRIAIMDQDGYNNMYLTDGMNLVSAPKLSPFVSSVVYREHLPNRSIVLKVKDLSSGGEKIIGGEGESFYSAPDFWADGKGVVFAKSIGAKTDIVSYNFLNNTESRLTLRSSINTSPSFAPNGKNLVFNSDRSGSQQLYVMSNSGKEQRRISFGGGSYMTPSWSPDGRWIAFSKMKNSRFYIGVMRPDGTDERILANSKSDKNVLEDPSWAINSQFIVYSEQDTAGSRSFLRVVDVSGYNIYDLPTPDNASSPSWSK